MKALITLLLITVATMLQAQTDTITVDITALQAQRITEINKAKADLKKQYDQAVKQLDSQLSDHLVFIADANQIDPRTIQNVQAIEAKSITYIVKKE